MADSGVTSVGVTRSGNWRCHPILFLKKLTTFYSRRSLQSLDPFWLSPCPVTTPTFRCRLSSVLSKFSHKKIWFRSGVTRLRGCPPRVRPPPSSPSDSTAGWHHKVLVMEKSSSTQFQKLVKICINPIAYLETTVFSCKMAYLNELLHKWFLIKWILPFFFSNRLEIVMRNTRTMQHQTQCYCHIGLLHQHSMNIWIPKQH